MYIYHYEPQEDRIITNYISRLLSPLYPLCPSLISLHPFHFPRSQNNFLKYHATYPTKHSKPNCHVSKVSCHSNQNNSTQNLEEGKLSHNLGGKNRRDFLIGFGELYGASTLSNNNNNLLAIAAPILPPDLETYGSPELPTDVKPATICCPPVSSIVIDFKLPCNIPIFLF